MDLIYNCYFYSRLDYAFGATLEVLAFVIKMLTWIFIFITCIYITKENIKENITNIFLINIDLYIAIKNNLLSMIHL